MSLWDTASSHHVCPRPLHWDYCIQITLFWMIDVSIHDSILNWSYHDLPCVTMVPREVKGRWNAKSRSVLGRSTTKGGLGGLYAERVGKDECPPTLHPTGRVMLASPTTSSDNGYVNNYTRLPVHALLISGTIFWRLTKGWFTHGPKSHSC